MPKTVTFLLQKGISPVGSSLRMSCNKPALNKENITAERMLKRKKTMNKKAVVILSGGLDSTVLLHYVRKQDYDVYGLSFNYGQRHKKEVEFAKYWGRKLCVEHKIIHLDFMREIAGNSALVDEKKTIPKEEYNSRNQEITVVPNRNMIMVSIGVAWAENLGFNEVFYGPHKNDYSIYPDCRPEFVENVSKTAASATYNHVRVRAPFLKKMKWEIVKIGAELGVDFSQTWSCYEGGEKHCGECATCQERKEAFLKAGISDPTVYLK